MTDQPQHVLTKAWKQQLDAGFRIIEAIVEGATKMREKQLEAAQAQWAAANAQKCVEYWRAMQETWMQPRVRW
jgi:diketogulonate reductase-like aldo/keto reductase